jgi:hypothetical protein
MLTTTDIYPLLLDIMYKMSVLATLDYHEIWLANVFNAL